MVADFCWENSDIKFLKIPIVQRYLSSSLFVLLTLSLVMSVRAEVKTESTAENEMSNKEVSSPLSSSDSEAVVPQSLGEHQIDMEESKHSGVAQNIEQHINKKSAKDSASESEVGSCKSQNLRTVERIEKSSGDAVETGKTMPSTVPSLEMERAGKEVWMQEELHHSGIVCSPREKEGCSTEIKVCDGKGDGQESGDLNVELSESGHDKTSSVAEDKERDVSEVQSGQDRLEEPDIIVVAQPVDEVPGAKQEVEVEDTHRDSDEDDKDNEDGDLMGYHFNEDEVLVDKNGEQFQFRWYEEHVRNQKRYERLGERINNYVYGLLETRCKLKKVYIPLDAVKEEPRSFIFVSEGALTTDDKLIIFIHGSGVVRAGQWARSLIINHSLRHGTQIPYIERALKDGYEVIVLNTNLNSLSKSRWPSHDEMIRGSEDPERHALYVWENLIEKDVKAKRIAIVAHSFGGVVTQDLVSRKHDEFSKRVFAIAFTDSVHSLNIVYDSTEVIEFFRLHARNWVTSNLPLDEPIKGEGLRHMNDAPRVSAGHEKHEWTSWSSFESVFKFLEKEYRIFISGNDENSKTQKPTTANL